MTTVKILGTGGTIASRAVDGRGAVASEPVENLLADVSDEVTVRSRDVLTTGSYRLSLREIRLIAEAVLAEAALAENDGIVVTHGTDTMEETAFLVDLVLAESVPVVFTGAQRSADAGDTDGPRNLADAVRVAADPNTKNWGAVICFDGEVWAAAQTAKMHTLASSPFSGGALLGRVHSGEVSRIANPVRRALLAPPTSAFDKLRVEVVPTFPGSDPELIDLLVERGADGIVLAGTGSGNAGPGYTEAVRRARAAGVPVALSTRVPFGPVVTIYGNGGGVDLVAAGALPTGSLHPFQARMLMALLLSHGANEHELFTALHPESTLSPHLNRTPE
ncbi:MAG: asparaginase [Micrococcaceae bacterium]